MCQVIRHLKKNDVLIIDFLDTGSYFLLANQNVHLTTHNQSKFV